MLIALDANIFIYVLERDYQFGPQALAILKAAELGTIDAVTSELVYLETLANSKLQASDVNRINRLLELSGVVFEPIEKPVVLEAARLRRIYGIKTPDAIHIASALGVKATHFVTNDKQLLRLKIAGLEIVSLDQALLLSEA